MDTCHDGLRLRITLWRDTKLKFATRERSITCEILVKTRGTQSYTVEQLNLSYGPRNLCTLVGIVYLLLMDKEILNNRPLLRVNITPIHNAVIYCSDGLRSDLLERPEIHNFT